jgi:hypothetical protein
MYHDTQITVEREKKIWKKFIKQGERHGCPLSSTLSNLDEYTDEVIRIRQIELEDTLHINNTELNNLLFADDQVIIAKSEDNFQKAV